MEEEKLGNWSCFEALRRVGVEGGGIGLSEWVCFESVKVSG